MGRKIGVKVKGWEIGRRGRLLERGGIGAGIDDQGAESGPVTGITTGLTSAQGLLRGSSRARSHSVDAPDVDLA